MLVLFVLLVRSWFKSTSVREHVWFVNFSRWLEPKKLALSFLMKLMQLEELGNVVFESFIFGSSVSMMAKVETMKFNVLCWS